MAKNWGHGLFLEVKSTKAREQKKRTERGEMLGDPRVAIRNQEGTQ